MVIMEWQWKLFTSHGNEYEKLSMCKSDIKHINWIHREYKPHLRLFYKDAKKDGCTKKNHLNTHLGFSYLNELILFTSLYGQDYDLDFHNTNGVCVYFMCVLESTVKRRHFKNVCLEFSFRIFARTGSNGIR